jgi:4-amino-4-deoxy-L-arabinose transferase-like glycosyltransferase
MYKLAEIRHSQSRWMINLINTLLMWYWLFILLFRLWKKKKTRRRRKRISARGSVIAISRIKRGAL